MDSPAQTDTRDFSLSSSIVAPGAKSSGHVNFDIEPGIAHDPTATENLRKSPSAQSDPEPAIDRSPTMLRRRNRSNTAKSAIDFMPLRPHWQAGQEPGLDPSKPNGGRNQLPTFHEECQITVVDFSEDDIYQYEFNNAQIVQFVQAKQDPWIKCRWINVNGLSWDVIQALGQYKNLHRLAMEDMINTSNRTKADWSVSSAMPRNLLILCAGTLITHIWFSPSRN